MLSKPLLLANEALEGLFSFNATPMAPLGTEVLVHMNPIFWRTWGYQASKAWYLLHATNHYQCIHVLMANTGSKGIINTFQSNDRIIDATERLTAAIAGIQDAPPNKVEAIQSLRTLLLGVVAPLPPPPPSILPTPQVPPPLININKPVIIWNPLKVQLSPTPLKHNTNNTSPNRITPAIVEDDSFDNTLTPITAHPHHLICPF
jgi:hypothetical protein